MANKFNLQCPGCRHIYIDTLIGNITKLVHPGTTFGERSPKMPTAHCVASYDYVLFEDCEHCCPETFGECPECTDGRVGTPTTKPCRCQ